MFKLIDNAIFAVSPLFQVHSASDGKAGETLTFSAEGDPAVTPVLGCHWDFGDGTTLDGLKVNHTYTHSGEYTVHVSAVGLDAIANSKTVTVSISGSIPTRFVPAEKKRAE
jgi:PKD repeat protein